MKTVFRNLLSVIRRFKMAIGLNIVCISVAFAAFIIIMTQVRYEQSFDTCHPTSGRVYRVTLQKEGLFSIIFPRAFTEAVIQSSPHIEAGTLMFAGMPYYFTYTHNGEKYGTKEIMQTCHSDIVKVFEFPIISGDAECLKDPDKIIIPESLAKKLFGDHPAIGMTIKAEEPIWTKSSSDLTVGAVYRDFPGNTQLKNCIYTAIDADFMLTNFVSSSYMCYLLLDDPSSVRTVEDSFNSSFDFSKIDDPDEQISLVALTDIYYRNEGIDEVIVAGGSRESTFLLVFISLLIIIVAMVNYTNFSTALTPVRMKSINIQKVLGSSDNFLRLALLLEAVFICMIAWVLSIFIVWLISLSNMLPFISADINPISDAGILLLSCGIALIAGVVAGFYPAGRMVSFPPSSVLKGNFGLSASGRRLRSLLVGFQFVVSIILIIGASLVQLQNNYMRNHSLGFDKDQIVIVELSTVLYDKYHETYTNRLKAYPGIADVAFSMEKLASQEVYNTSTSEYKNKEFQYFMIPVSYNFFDVMGISIEEGRNFSEADERSDETTYIFNKNAHDNMEMTVGDRLDNWLPGRIVGFTGDVKFSSLRNGADNVAFVIDKEVYSSKPVSYIRLERGVDVYAAVSHIRKTLSEIDAIYPFNIEFYDTIFDQFYYKEESLRSRVALLGLLAIIISLVGVFGLVVFDTQYKRKEIAIRKIHGSTISGIIKLINKQYVYIVFVCFVLAVPAAYYVINLWLENFAYKTPIYWWVFAIALLIVLSITTMTVTFQCWRAAVANPVESIKTE